MFKQDPRFEKTEIAIQESFLHLLTTKSCSKISVKEICQLAQISRNAFYQHYETKNHLYQAMQTDILLAMEEAFRPIVDNPKDIQEAEKRKFINNILTAVEQQKNKIYHLLRSKPDYFSLAFRDILVRSCIKSSHQFPESINFAYLHIFSGAVSSYISFWLLETDLTLEEAQQQLYNTLELFGT